MSSRSFACLVAIALGSGPKLARAQSAPGTSSAEFRGLPSVRLAAGVASSPRDGAAFGFDATVGANIWRTEQTHPGLLIHPEIGYSFASVRGARHAFSATVGFGVLVPPRIAAYATAGLLLGTEAGTNAAGARLGVRFELPEPGFGLELDYDYLHVGSGDEQTIRAMLSVDLAWLFLFAVVRPFAGSYFSGI